MNETDRRPDASGLDARLQQLPPAIAPGRDLWPAIEARLEPRVATQSRRWTGLWQVAAAVLLVAGSSLLTATLMRSRDGAGTIAAVPTPAVATPEPARADVVQAMPVAFGPGKRLDAEYVAARMQLTAVLDERLARMPASSRVKLEASLGELRRAAEQINAALAEQPGDPLLQELLLATYQEELAMLANVNQLTSALAANGRGAEPKRMDL
jgi:hypothetical protein